MWWDFVKDYLNSFIGAFLLFISIFLIPEIKRKRKYWIPILALTFLLCILGIDKLSRDDHKQSTLINEIQTSNKNFFDLKRRDSILYFRIDSSLQARNLKLIDGRVYPINITVDNNSSTNVTSYGQKGGQTAAKIVGH